MKLFTNKNTVNALLLSILASTIFFGCNKDQGPLIIENANSLNEAASYSKDIQPIFDYYCIECHTAKHYTGLNLKENASYSLLVGVKSLNYDPVLRVKPNYPDSSILWHKVNDTKVYGNKMPKGDKLKDFELKKIRTWIEKGALNN